MEQYGYPDFLLASADKLIDRQYADRQQLRPIFDALLAAATGLENVVVQTRKTYVSLVTPVRTFARIVPATKQRVDLGLEPAQLITVGEDDLADLGAVDLAVGSHLGPPTLGQPPHQRLGVEQLVDHPVA